MAKRKKTVLSFMMIITAGYAFWNTMKGISVETNIPIFALLLVIALIYLIWKEED